MSAAVLFNNSSDVIFTAICANKYLHQYVVNFLVCCVTQGILFRAGIYVQPGKIKGTKLEQKQQPWSKNPRLSDITDTSEETFISKIACGLTLEEFEVFREMYSEELNKEVDSETEDSLSDNE
jgi:hypothetical protein